MSSCIFQQTMQTYCDELSVKCNQLQIELEKTRNERDSLQQSFAQRNKDLIALQVEHRNLQSKVKNFAAECFTSNKEV